MAATMSDRAGGQKRASNIMSETSHDAHAGDFAEAIEPFLLFESWFGEAREKEPNDPNAMAIATCDPSGLPNVRMVLLKGLDGPNVPGRGFVFYTNLESAKGRNLPPIRRPRSCFIGRVYFGRCGRAGSSRRCRRMRRTSITLRGIARAASGRGPPSNRVRWKAGWRWRRLLRSRPRASGSAPFRGHRTGRVSG